MGKQNISQVRHFSINFQQLAVVSSLNSLFVLDANHSLSIVDVLDGHKLEIIAFDVSQAQKIVASISERQLVIHCLVDSEPGQNFIKDNIDNKIQNEQKLQRADYLHLIQTAKSSRTETKLNHEPLQDFAVYTGDMRWIMTFRVDLSPELPAVSLAMSQLGDFLVIAGRQNLTVWCQELQFDTFNKHIIYTLDEKPEEYSQVKEQLQSLTGEIIQVEICGAGRMIVSLEKGKRTLKIWHQDFAMIKPDKEPDVKVRTQKFDPLEVYELPSSQLRGISKDNNKFAISRFQILHKEFNSLWIVPTVIITISEGTQEVAIWVESLTEQSLQFNCVKVIIGKPSNSGMTSIFDAQFLQSTQYTPRQEVEKVEKWHASPLFEAWRDKELYFKKIFQPKNENFGIVPHKLRPRPLLSQNTNAALVDWLLMITDDRIEIFKCTGLRDFPQRTASIELYTILHIPKSIISLFQPTLIQHAYCKSFTDQINLLCTNQNGQLIKLWCDVHDPLTEVKIEASSMLQGSKTSIKELLSHPQLPVVALILEREIQVFIQKEITHPIQHRPEMQYLGNFQSTHEILSAKWIPDTLQLLVLDTSRDTTVNVVSQRSLFKLGGMLEDPQKLQSELNSKATKLSPSGALYEIEPENFEVVVKVAIDIVGCKEIFLVSHELHLQKQALVFAAITQTGQQQLRKMTWEVEQSSAVNIQSEVLESRYGFDDGFKLDKILASNEAHIFDSTFVLVVVSKEQEQELVVRGPEKKPFCKMILLEYSKHSINERFVLEGIAEELLESPIHARFGKKQLGMIISQGDFHNESKHLYIYDFVEHKYKGFIDFSAMVYGQTKTSKVDFAFIQDLDRGALAVFVDDDAYLLGEKETKWNLEHKIKGFFNFEASTIQSLKIQIINNQYNNCMIALINNQHIHSFFDDELLANFNQDDDAPKKIDQFQLGNFRENSLHNHFVQIQRSMALFYPGLLEALYIKGYASLVVKLMVKMHEALQKHQSQEDQQVISDYIDMDLEALLIEIKSQSAAFVLAQGGGQAQAASSKKVKAFSAFDDLDSSSSEEEKKGKAEDTSKDYIKEFKASCDDFIQLLMKRAMVTFGLTKQETMHLIAFVLKFRNIFEKEFYSDVLASQLLRKIFVESEEVDANFMQTAQTTIEYYNEHSKKEILSKTEDIEHGELHLCKDWTSEMVAQALHSENQDVILDTLSKRFDFDQYLTWSLMRRLSIPLWLKEVSKLKELLELVIKNEYKIAKEKEALAKGLEKQKLEQMDRDGKMVFGNKEALPPKVESSALWYILLGKLTILQNLYKYEPGQEKFSEFFAKNFKDEKVRSIAGKNAMALVPKKKYLLACGFFILANDLVGAANVAIDRLKDPTLALMMCKIHDPTNQTKQLDRILDNEFIKRGEILNDLYIQNIGSWLKKDFLMALNLFSSEKDNNALKFMFKSASIEFNLCPQLQRPPAEVDISRKPKGENFIKFNKEEEEVQQYPLISQKSYIILDLVKKLQKAPDVKRMLNKNWTLDNSKGQKGKSIFDDFLGEDDESSEEAEKPAILINEANLLQLAVQQTLNQRYTILGMLLIEENPTLRSQISTDQRLKLAKTILQDQIVGLTNKNKVQKHNNLKAVFSLLSKALDIHLNSAMDLILNACRKLGLIKEEIEIMHELNDDELILDRIFTQSSRLSGFILQCNKFGGFLFDGSDINLAINEHTLPLIGHIVKLIECLIFQSTQPPSAAENQSWNQSISSEKRPKQSFFDDEDEDEGNVRQSDNLLLNKVTNQIKNQNKTITPFVNAAQSVQNDQSFVEEKNKLNNEINLKLRSMIFILTTMFHLALLFNKHHLMKELMVQIQTLVNVSLQFGIQFADGSMSLEKLEQANGQFQFQAVKVMAIKLRNTIERNLKWGSQAFKQMKADAELGQYDAQFQRRKEARDLDQTKNPAHFQFMRVWLKAACVHQLLKLFQEKRLKDLQFITCLPQKNIIVEQSSNKLKHFSNEYDFLKRNLSLIELLKASYLQKTSLGFVTLVDSFECFNETMEDVITHLFQNRLTLKDQFSLVNDLENFHKNRYMTSNGQAVDGSYFFPSDLKFKDFFLNLELHAFTALLKEHHLSLLRTRQGGDNSGDYSHDSQNPYTNQVDRLSESPSKVKKQQSLSSVPQHISSNLLKTANSYEFDRGMDSGTETYVNLKLSNGIEIFKQKNECISDFCFDSCQNDSIAFAMQARGMREISIKNTLLYRNRTVQGFEFVDEEYLSWTECLHRLDQIAIIHQKLKPKSDAVKAAYGMICQPSSFGTHKLEKRRHLLLIDQEFNPPAKYLGDAYDNYLRPSSNLDITHEDYTNAIQSHPKLPLYVTGNSKGLLCLWSFGQIKDQSLNQWILDPDVPPNLANPKKSTVKKIAFSDSGDKIGALNMEGAFFMMNFDLSEISKQTSLFTTKNWAKNKEFRANDFQFLDADSVIACCSLKEKSLQVFDTMMPQKHSCVLTLKAGGAGNLMTVNTNKQKIYCFNAKPGQINEYDLRMMKDTVNSASLGKEEITAVTIDPISDALIVGFADGVVKIYDDATVAPVATKYKKVPDPVQLAFNARETINAFTNVDGKKKPVSQLKVNPDNGGLFASTAGGIIKILRLRV